MNSTTQPALSRDPSRYSDYITPAFYEDLVENLQDWHQTSKTGIRLESLRMKKLSDRWRVCCLPKLV